MNAVAYEFESILRYAGFWVVHEERQLFTTDDKDKQNRPDSSINNPQSLNLSTNKTFHKVLVDYSITCPLKGSVSGLIEEPSSRDNAMKVGDMADMRYKQKFSHYEKLINDLNREHPVPINYYIQPIVFQTSGLMEKHGLGFLEKVADAAEEVKRISSCYLFTYFKRRLSCCLVKNMCASINSRGHSIMGHLNFDFDRSFDARFIMEQF